MGASVGSVASNAGSIKMADAANSAGVRTTSTGKKFVGVTPLPGYPMKLSLASVPRPGPIHSSISGGSTVSNSISRRVVRRKMVLKKKSGDVEPTTPEVLGEGRNGEGCYWTRSKITITRDVSNRGQLDKGLHFFFGGGVGFLIQVSSMAFKAGASRILNLIPHPVTSLSSHSCQCCYYHFTHGMSIVTKTTFIYNNRLTLF